jgi:hypothetical protein
MFSRLHLLTCCAIALGLGLLSTGRATAADELRPLRPPAVPLVACDPYFSIWSFADRLTDGATRHWTGKTQSLSSMIRIDGKTYRLMGNEPKDVPALPQVGLVVLPTRTIYDFENAEAHVTLTFTTPALPDDLDILSRPLTYLTWDVRSLDGKSHATSVYFSASAELAVNDPSQRVDWSYVFGGDLRLLRIGTEEQPVLRKKGDDLRIDWGYAYVAAPSNATRTNITSDRACSQAFIDRGKLPESDDTRKPRAANNELPVMAVLFDLGMVAEATVARHLLLAYDDLHSITYFRQNLRPYWSREGMQAPEMLQRSEAEYETLRKRCQAFDDELMADLRKAGGEKYARLAALAYRQCLAANKLAADPNGQPLLFPKENFSNGCIATVDVIYPMDPFFLLFSPTLTRASLVTVLSYAASDRWKFPFAPHDLGTYPLANGQVYGGGERTEENQMPVEESGDMLLLIAALARLEGDGRFTSEYWPQLTRWAHYLEEKGFDPENQLCTDDFAGHLAHNVNLSAKAILALGAYGLLCEMRGEKEEGARYHKLAEGMARKWVEAADDGDHFRLAFDRPGTWSQKYNLVWDRLLGLNLFPVEVVKKEMAFYLRTQDRYGLPLDNRKPYAKLDWTVWTATMADNRADFEALVGPLYDFLNDTPDRVPMSDWYWTKDAKQAGFQARSVVGGVFIKLLSDRATWQKWASRDKGRASGWAPIPLPPIVKEIVPTARQAPIVWRFTVKRPEGDWTQPGFDDTRWTEAAAGFGTAGTPGTDPGRRTEWRTPDIWLRREFVFPEGSFANPHLFAFHDEDAEFYINGVPAGKISGYTTDYETVPISPEGRAALRPGKNVIAVHCHQTGGGQYIDVGFVDVIERDRR